MRPSDTGAKERALPVAGCLPFGCEPSAPAARADKAGGLVIPFAIRPVAGFRMPDPAAAGLFSVCFEATAFFAAGLLAACFEATAFFAAGFFAAAAFFPAAVRPLRAGAGAVKRGAPLPFVTAEAGLALPLLPAFLFVTRFDLPAMVSLSLRLCRKD